MLALALRYMITVNHGDCEYAATVPKNGGKRRQRGSIRKRGNSLQVLVYAGIDPLTNQRMYLSESTTDEAEAERIRNRFLAQVDAQQNPRTRATLGAALDAWLRIHEVEANTRQGCEAYTRKHIRPALGDVPVGKVTAKTLEDFTPGFAGAGLDVTASAR